MAYTTEEVIQNYLNIDIDDSFSSQIDTWISMAETWINNYTDREFESSSLVKKYDGNGKTSLIVDDILSVSNIWLVENDSTADASTEAITTYYLYQDDDPNETPYNRIQLKWDGTSRTFEVGQQNVWIEGTWGYSETAPLDIQMITAKMVGSIINAGRRDGVESFSEGDYSVTYADFDRYANKNVGIKDVLNYYKKKERITGYKAQRV